MGPRRSIHLFDLDDTLISSPARIFVRKADGAVVQTLTPAEFTEFKLPQGYTFDFKEFSDVGILSRGIVVHYTRDIIRQLVERGTKSAFGILTARGDKSLHAPFLIRLFRNLFGIRLQKGLIFAVSDARFNRYKDRGGPKRGKPYSSLSVAERKARVVLEDLVGRGYNDISFYDDSRENLAAFRTLAKDFPDMQFKAHFIDPSWTQRLKEFVAGDLDEKTLVAGEKSFRLIWENHGALGQPADAALERVRMGEPIPLRTFSVDLVFREERFRLMRRT
jgi:hypothetical protein